MSSLGLITAFTCWSFDSCVRSRWGATGGASEHPFWRTSAVVGVEVTRALVLMSDAESSDATRQCPDVPPSTAKVEPVI